MPLWYSHWRHWRDGWQWQKLFEVGWGGDGKARPCLSFKCWQAANTDRHWFRFFLCACGRACVCLCHYRHDPLVCSKPVVHSVPASCVKMKVNMRSHSQKIQAFVCINENIRFNMHTQTHAIIISHQNLIGGTHTHTLESHLNTPNAIHDEQPSSTHTLVCHVCVRQN